MSDTYLIRQWLTDLANHGTDAQKQLATHALEVVLDVGRLERERDEALHACDALLTGLVSTQRAFNAGDPNRARDLWKARTEKAEGRIKEMADELDEAWKVADTWEHAFRAERANRDSVVEALIEVRDLLPDGVMTNELADRVDAAITRLGPRDGGDDQ